MLTREQTTIVDAVLKSTESICLIHGPAGSGKSVVRDKILSLLPTSTCLGPTGMSIQGSPFPDRTMTIAKFIKKKGNHDSTSAIVIDEMSMVSAKDFEALFTFAAESRFILIGDFYQLMPVDKQYFFSSDTWKHAQKRGIKTWRISTNMRISREDPEEAEELQYFLNSIRSGSFYTSPRARDMLDYIFAARKSNKSALVICPTNEIAQSINTRQLQNLDSPWIGTKGQWKVGSKIQITRNIYKNKKIVVPNGCLGSLLDIRDSVARVQLAEKSSYILVPVKHIRLGYAITVHGAQGLSLDHVHIVGPNLFEGRQHLYTAFSRAKSLSGITVNGLSSYDIDDLPKELPKELTIFLKRYNLEG